MEIKVRLDEGVFEGLDARLFYTPGKTSTILFNTMGKEWSAISLSGDEEKGKLNFYSGTEVVKTYDDVGLEEALVLVRAAQIDRRNQP